MSEITRTDSPGFLNLDEPERLFRVLIRAFGRYEAEKTKRIDDVFLLVLGLSHLREWIAPGFKGQHEPRNPAERFSKVLYENESYRLVLQLANHAKHQFRDDRLTIKSVHYPRPESWTEFESASWDDNDDQVKDYFVNARNLSDVFDEVLCFCRDHWFSFELHDQLGTREERMRTRFADNGKYHRLKSPREG